MTPSTGKRILMLLENAPYSWDGRVRREANTLAAAGYRVTVICRQGPGEGWYEQFGPIIAYQYPPPPAVDGLVGYLLEYVYTLVATMLLTCWIAARRGFDCIHAHNPPDLFVLVGGFWRLCGKRFVFDQHDLAPEMYLARFGRGANQPVHRALLFFERLSCRWADQVIVANDSCRRLIIRRTGIRPGKVTVVRNGPEACHLQMAAPLAGLRRDPRALIGYVGVMGHQDGVDYLLRALGQLVRTCQRSDWRCVLVGDGESVPALKQLAIDLGIAGQVQFTGWLDYRDVPRYIAAMDICVAPDPSNEYSDRSTIIKLMEYMAQAKPMVAFDLPEHRVTADDVALYASPNDELDFARQIARLMDDPHLRERLGQLGRLRAANTLAWSRQEHALLGTYERIVVPHFGLQEVLRGGTYDVSPITERRAQGNAVSAIGGTQGPG
jgi:glycosyltransferase involved in cell wall biosynthesis